MPPPLFAETRSTQGSALRSFGVAGSEQGARYVKKARSGNQEEVDAEQAATPQEQIHAEKSEARYRDEPAGQLAPPRDRKARHYPDREEQEAESLTGGKSQVLAPSEREREQEEGAGDAQYSSRPTQDRFRSQTVLVILDVL